MNNQSSRYIVYLLTNLKTEKHYVGITKNSVNRRWIQHKCAAKRGDTWKLHNAIRKYSPHCWSQQEIYVCYTVEDALVAERELVSSYDSYRSGYNSTGGGEGYRPYFGRHHSEATKQKLRAIHKGKSYHPGKAGKDNPRYGRPGTMTGRTHTEAAHKKMSDNHHRNRAITFRGVNYRSMSSAARSLGWTLDKLKYHYIKSQSPKTD